MASELIKISTEQLSDSKTSIWEKYVIILSDKTGFNSELRGVGT